jgi:two-component system nitrate/nitrite sensor histidine kinase NarX
MLEAVFFSPDGASFVNILKYPQRLDDGASACPEADARCDELGILPEGFIEAIVREAGAVAGVVRVPSPEGATLRIVGSASLPAEMAECERVTEGTCGVCGEAMQKSGMRISSSAYCRQQSGLAFFDGACKQVVAVPLFYRGGNVGVMTLFYAEADGAPRELARILAPCAELVGIALENGRRQDRELRDTLMAERHAMANEIHDTLAHTLYFARMRMNLLQDALRTHNAELVQKCADDVDEALASGQKAAREIITHFRCQMDSRGLQYALQNLADEFARESGIELAFSRPAPEFKLPIEHEIQVFRIMREALANVAAHSGASRAQLAVECSGGWWRFIVEDNGSGCAVPVEGHYGLMIMRERSLRIGGKISIEGAQGGGTKVELSFPEP